jgi:hypothetical protein
VPEPSSCQWQEQNPTISQTGTTVQLNINKDEFAEGKLTSNITVAAGPPFNSLGLTPEGLAECNCGWAGLPHYRMKGEQ